MDSSPQVSPGEASSPAPSMPSPMVVGASHAQATKVELTQQPPRRPYVQNPRRASAGAELTMRDSFLFSRDNPVGTLRPQQSSSNLKYTKPQAGGSVIIPPEPRQRGHTASTSISGAALAAGPMISFQNPLLQPTASPAPPTSSSSASSLAGVLRRLTRPELNTSFDNFAPIPEDITATPTVPPSEEDKKAKKKLDRKNSKAKGEIGTGGTGGHHFFSRKHHAAVRDERRMRRLLDAVSIPLASSELSRLLKKKHYTTMLNEQGPDDITPLIAAMAGEGGLEVVQILIEKGADVDGKGPNGRRPLHWAALFGEIAIVTYLLDNGAKVDARDADANTPLHEAAFVGAGDTIDLLLAKGADSQSRDKHGYTPLHKAAFSGQSDAILGLLTQPLDIDALDDSGATPLHIAIYNGHYDVVCLLLSFGARLGLKDKRGCSSVHFAVHGGDSRTLTKLIELGGEVNQPDQQGVYPIHVAAFAGYSHILTHLLAAGADPNIKDMHGATPLHYAAGSGDVASTMMLIAYRARLNSRDEGGYTPLHHAVRNGHCESASILLEYKANIDVVSKSGKTALHYALDLEDINLAKKLCDLLIAMGANRMVPNAENLTAQDLALERGIVLLEFCKSTSLKSKRVLNLVVSRVDNPLEDSRDCEPCETEVETPHSNNTRCDVVPIVELAQPIPPVAQKEDQPTAEIIPPTASTSPPTAEDLQPKPEQQAQVQSDVPTVITGTPAAVEQDTSPVTQPMPTPEAQAAPIAPPLPPGGPAPPPPPLGGTPQGQTLTRNRLRRFDWEPIASDKVKDTIFGDLTKANATSTEIPLDTQRLHELFFIKAAVNRQRDATMRGKDSSNTENQVMLLADQDKVKQLEMLLRSSQRGAKQAMMDRSGDSIAKDDKGEIDWDEEQRRHFRQSLLGDGLADLGKGFIESFLSRMPTDTEMKAYKNYVPSDNVRLHLVDAFFFSLREVNMLRERIKASLFRIEFPSIVQELTREMDSLHSTVKEIRESPKLKRMIKWVLDTVNYLNDGHTKMGMPMTATGFHISCLTQLKDMSASGPIKTNLIRFMALEIEQKEPSLLSIKDELPNLRPSWKDRMDWIREKPNALDAQLSEIKATLDTMKPVDNTDSFCSKLKRFVDEANATIQGLKKKSRFVLAHVHQLYAYLGESSNKEGQARSSKVSRGSSDDAPSSPQEDSRWSQMAQLNREMDEAIAKNATKKLYALSRRITRLAQEVQAASTLAAADAAQAADSDAGGQKDGGVGKDAPDIFAILHQFLQDFEDAIAQNKEAQRQLAEAQKRRSLIEQKRQKAAAHATAPGVASPRLLRNLIKSPEDLRNVTSLQMMQHQKRINNVPHELAQRQQSQKDGLLVQKRAAEPQPRTLVLPVPGVVNKLSGTQQAV